jgi:predicted anti-sigma-YlaC factor YlaD
MLSCQELVELVTDYLEGALAAHEEALVVAHLRDCSDCLRYIGQIQQTTRLLAQLGIDDGGPEQPLGPGGHGAVADGG